jgi:signal transduction histidine kinase
VILRLRSATSATDALVVAVFLAAELTAAVTHTDGSRAALLLFPLGWTLPLLARRRFPVASLLTVFGTLAVESQLAQEGTTSLAALAAVLLAFWLAGGLPERAAALATGAAGAACTAVVLASNPGPVDAGDAVFAAVAVLLPFGSAMVLANRDRRAAYEREQRAAAAIEQERARIARDLHDVVGHALSMMTVQAGAARLRLEPERHPVIDQVTAIEETGREALGEMRRMLGMLRDDAEAAERDPQPGLATLEALLERSRGAGMAVELEVSGAPAPLAPGVDLAAYRIVQEALTNVRKHAAGARAVVTLAYEREHVCLVVANDGSGPAAPANGSGHGLVGMRERAAMYGGEVIAGPRAEGGFAVRARLPLHGGEA